MEPEPSYLYVISAAAHTNGPCKLGISADPDRRLIELQTGHPDRLIVRHREAVDAVKAPILEALLHRDIAHHRSWGEWFNVSVEQAIADVSFTQIRYGDIDRLAEKFRKRSV